MAVLEWKEAAPLIGVLATGILGLIGALIAARRRENAGGIATSGAPAAIAGAIAERGVAEGLTLAVGGLTGVLAAYSEREEEWRQEDEDLGRKRHREVMDEMRRMTLAIEEMGRRRSA